jgi:putative heme-binding domain-containing protein
MVRSKPLRLILIVAGWLFGGGAASLSAQPQTYADADVQYGARIYAEQCTVCHSATGDAVAGVDLRANRFKRPLNDNELRGVISNGVAGTGMPPFKFTPPELTAVIAYLRKMRDFDSKLALIGDVAKGKALFEGKAQCSSCHRVYGKGPRVAPDLSDIGALRTPDLIRRAIIFPEAEVRPANRSVRAVTSDGKVVTGRRLNEDTYTVQVIDEQERLVSLVKASLREYNLVRRTAMPSYRDTLAADELADLLAYLLSLKGL